jgi:hypothetical protein
MTAVSNTSPLILLDKVGYETEWYKILRMLLKVTGSPKHADGV